MSAEQDAPKTEERVQEEVKESAPQDEKVDVEEPFRTPSEKVPEQELEDAAEISEHSEEGSDREEDEYESAEEHDDQDDKRRRRETLEEDEASEAGEEAPNKEGEDAKVTVAGEKKVKEPREDGDGQEAEDADAKVDDDEDRRNPQYIPKRGMFYEHDDRIDSDDEEAKKKAAEEESKKKKRVWKSEAINKWGHDKFAELDQVPKSKEELVEAYGYDIRNEDNAPRARRRRRYGRGPNKYTRNWEDEEAYSGAAPQKDSRGRGRGRGGGGSRPGRPDETEEEFPALGNNDAGQREESNRGSFRGSGTRGRGANVRADNDAGRRGNKDVGRRGEDGMLKHNDEATGRGGEETTGRRGEDPVIRREDDTMRRRNDPTSRRRDDQYSRRAEEGRRGNDPRGRGISRGGRGGFREDRREDRSSANERLVKPPKTVEHGRENLERKVDSVEKDLARSSLEERRPMRAQEKPQSRVNPQQVDDTSGKRYSSLRQPKTQQQPPPAQQQQSQHHQHQQNVSSPQHNVLANAITTTQNYYEHSPIVVTSTINGAHYATYPSEALAAAFPPGHYPNGPPAGAPFINNQPIRPGGVPHPSSYINPGMVSYGPPPVQYTPVTVPMSLPLVGLPAGPHDTFVPPALPGGALLPPHLAVVTSPEQQVLMVASPPPGTQGYAVERGGVTYFNPTAQAPIVQRAVSRRPKAAIPIVDPSHVRGEQEEEMMSQQNSSEGAYVEVDGGGCSDPSKILSEHLAAES